MYEFIDTTDCPTGGLTLPAEAVQVNGVWLDAAVSGFRTLYTTGRERIAAEVTDLASGTRDGCTFQRRRFLPRTIAVGFQLLADSAEEFRREFDRLNGLLAAPQLRLIFADEPDRFYTGTKTGLSRLPGGRNQVTGEIEFYCADPFKYAVEEKTVTPSDGGSTLAVDYAGTYPAFPTLRANLRGDCGFVSFLHDNGSCILIGDEDEADGTYTYSGAQTTRSTTVFSDNFSAGVPDGWTVNRANLVLHRPNAQTGQFVVKNTQKGAGIAPEAGTTGEGWHGPSITKQVWSGAKDFRLKFSHLFAAPEVSDLCAFQVAVTGTDESGERRNICGMSYYRISNGDPHCHAGLFAGGEGVGKISVPRGLTNRAAGVLSGETIVARNGSTFTFGLPNGAWRSVVVPGLEELAVTEVSFYLASYGTATAGKNVLLSARLTDSTDKTFHDLPNLFSAGDVVAADCRSGAVTVNGSPNPGMGALGNAWESFVLSPGVNQIACVCSPWAAQTPDYSLKYREVFV